MSQQTLDRTITSAILRSRRKQLSSIELARYALLRGAPGPRHVIAVRVGAAAAAFAVAAGSFVFDLSPAPALAAAGVFGFLAYFLAKKRASLPDTNAEHLDVLLANYDPASKEDYRWLQGKIREVGHWDDHALSSWIALEKSVLSDSSKSQNTEPWHFLRRSV